MHLLTICKCAKLLAILVRHISNIYFTFCIHRLFYICIGVLFFRPFCRSRFLYITCTTLCRFRTIFCKSGIVIIKIFRKYMSCGFYLFCIRFTALTCICLDAILLASSCLNFFDIIMHMFFCSRFIVTCSFLRNSFCIIRRRIATASQHKHYQQYS